MRFSLKTFIVLIGISMLAGGHVTGARSGETGQSSGQRARNRAQSSADVEAPETSFAFANGLLEKGELSMAVEEYRNILQEYPDYGRLDAVLFRLGQAYYRQEKYAQAKTVLTKLKNKYPDSSARENAMLLLGNTYGRLNSPKKAASAFGKAADEGGEFAKQALVLAGMSWAKAGEGKKAEKYLRKYLQQHPGGENYPQAASTLVSLLAERKNYAEARDVLNTAMQQDADNKASYRLQNARLFSMQGETDRAKKALRKIIESKNEDAAGVAALELARILRQQGETARAGQMYERAAKLSASQGITSSALFNAGATYHRAKKHEKAVSIFAQLLEKYPQYDLVNKARLLAGLSAFNVAEYQLAANHLKEVDYGSLSEADASSLVTALCLTYYRQNKPDAARQFCRTVLDTSKRPAVRQTAYFQLAGSYAATKGPDKAIQTLSEAEKELKDENFTERAELQKVQYLFQAGKFKKARKLAQKLLQDDGNLSQATRTVAHFRIAASERRLGNAEAAATHFLKAFEAGGQGAFTRQCLFLAAESFRQAGKHEKATANYRRLREEFPDSALAQQAQLGLGVNAVQMKKFSTGQTMLEKYLSSNQKDTPGNMQMARRFLGVALLNQSKPGKAVPVLEEILKDKKLSKKARLETLQTLGIALQRAGQHSKSATRFHEAAQVADKRKPTFLILAGQGHLNAREFQKAADVFRKTLESSNLTEKVQKVTRVLLARSLQGQEKYAEAEEQYRKALPTENLQAYAGLAACLAETGSHREAARNYLKVNIFAQNPKTKAEALLNAAEAFSRAGVSKKATKYLKQVAEKYPDTEYGNRARKRLGMEKKQKMDSSGE